MECWLPLVSRKVVLRFSDQLTQVWGRKKKGSGEISKLSAVRHQNGVSI